MLLKSRIELNLSQRYEIVRKLETGLKQSQIAEIYNVDRSTIAKIKKNSHKIKEDFESGTTNNLQKRRKSFHFGEVEETLFQWFLT